MNKYLTEDEFIKAELAARYAPPYLLSTIITNKLILNGFTPSISTGLVMTSGNLSYFPEAEVVPLIDMLQYLGYTRNNIIDLYLESSVNVVAAGMGGINNGIMYWINRLEQELGLRSSNKITFIAFDDDFWDISNVPRIHFNSLGVDPKLPKADWMGKVLKAHKSNINYASKTSKIPVDKLKEYSNGSKLPIVFGATDITTRGLLSRSPDCVYLQIAQSDHDLNMFLNPEITMKTRDTYGNLFLNEFHIMTLKAAITLLTVVKRHSENAINPIEEEEVELFNIQEYDREYGIPNWLGVVPKGVTYSRHNGYQGYAGGDDAY